MNSREDGTSMFVNLLIEKKILRIYFWVLVSLLLEWFLDMLISIYRPYMFNLGIWLYKVWISLEHKTITKYLVNDEIETRLWFIMWKHLLKEWSLGLTALCDSRDGRRTNEDASKRGMVDFWVNNFRKKGYICHLGESILQ